MRIYVPIGSELIEAGGFDTIDNDLYKKPTPGSILDEDLEIIEGKVVIDKKSGTRINNEFGKTVFGNWVLTDPGETKNIVLKYKLPFSVNLRKPEETFWDKVTKYFDKTLKPSSFYSILVQKQSGSDKTSYSSEIILPKNLFFLTATNLSNIKLSTNKASISRQLDHDIYYGFPLLIN